MSSRRAFGFLLVAGCTNVLTVAEPREAGTPVFAADAAVVDADDETLIDIQGDHDGAAEEPMDAGIDAALDAALDADGGD